MTVVEQTGSRGSAREATDRWREIAVATGPADRAAAEEGIRRAYRQAGLAEPRHVVWVGSPLRGAAAALVLTGRVSAEQRAEGTGSAGILAEAERALRAVGVDPTPEGAGLPVREAVRSRPWERARRSALAALGPAGWAQLWSFTGAELWPPARELADRIRTGVVDALTADPKDETAVRLALLDSVAGQHDGPWLAAFDAATVTAGRIGAADVPEVADRSAGSPEPAAPAAGGEVRTTGTGAAGSPRLEGQRLEEERLEGERPDGEPGEYREGFGLDALAAVAREACWWWPYENVVVVSERAGELHRDEAGRLDRADGPALCFPDGFALHAWRGMPVPAAFLGELAGLTPERIRAEENAELRRVMLEHYGYQRYLDESGAEPLHRDETGVLWRIELAEDEPVVMVEVLNSTPEPDGTRRTYWLRVPPRTSTAREGVAWTFGLDASDYQPRRET